jgi:hypothetical protein
LNKLKFIVLTLICLVAVPVSIVVAYGLLTPVSLGPGPYRPPEMEIPIASASYDSKENAIFLNCTLLKGYKGATECNLTKIIVANYKAKVFEGSPVPSKLMLNQTTIVKVNLGKPLPPEIYYLQLKSQNYVSYYTLNVGNFTDPQKQIEVKQVSYNYPDKAVFVECNRIEERTDLWVVIKDSQGQPVATDYRPNRTQTAQGTIIKVNLEDALAYGQYAIYLVTEKGLIKNFTVP